MRKGSTSVRSPCSPAGALSNTDVVRVGIRGGTGLLGQRLAAELQKRDDMVLALIVVRDDPTLERWATSKANNCIPYAARVPTYLDTEGKKLDAVNEKYKGKLKLEDVHQVPLHKKCDVLIDATSPRSGDGVVSAFATSGKPVLLQSGEYPRGRLISPPLMARGEGNAYRMGGCITSALAPVLSAVKSELTSVRAHVEMQLDAKLMEYSTYQNINAVYLPEYIAKVTKSEYTSEQMVESELRLLLRSDRGKPRVEVGITHRPAIKDYCVDLRLNTRTPMSGRDLRDRLGQSPRVMVAEGILSTSELTLLREQAQTSGNPLPSVVVYGVDLESTTPKSVK